MSSDDITQRPPRLAYFSSAKFFISGLLLVLTLVCLYFLFCVGAVLILGCSDCESLGFFGRVWYGLWFGYAIMFGLLIYFWMFLIPLAALPPLAGLYLDYRRRAQSFWRDEPPPE